MDHLTIIDEAQIILGNDTLRNDAGPPRGFEVMQTCRAFREGIILSTNHLANLAEVCLVNTGTKIGFKQTEGHNAYTFARATSLSKEEANTIPRLPDRTAILSAKHPYLFRTIDVPYKLFEIYDTDVAKFCEPNISKYKIIPRSRTNQASTKEDSVSIDEKKMLMAIYMTATLTKTQIYTASGFSNDKGNRTSTSLLSKSLIKELAINLGGKGNGIKILYLTQKGYNTIGMAPQNHTRGEGPEHSYWTKRYQQQLKTEGLDATTHHRLNGKEPDLTILRKNNRPIAIEISISTTIEHEYNQIKKDLIAGYSHVLTLLKTEQKTQKLTNMIINSQDIDTNKIRISLLKSTITEELDALIRKGGQS